MITSKAIPICRSPFQGESTSRMSSSSSPRSVGAASHSSSARRKSGYGMVTMAYRGARAVSDPHSTLEIAPGASKHEIKKAYRRLALQFHPDVCEGNHCTTNFQQINFAYEALLNATTPQFGEFEDDLSDNLEGFAGVGDDSWEEWEEWMGWREYALTLSVLRANVTAEVSHGINFTVRMQRQQVEGATLGSKSRKIATRNRARNKEIGR